MAIIGLTDNIKPAFPCIGKLRKGGVKTASGFGKELDYWRFTSDRPEIVEAFTAAYGDKPRLINIFLPYATVEDNFAAWKEAWTGGGLKHRCDGRTTTIYLGSDGKYHTDPKPCPGGCDEVARLSFIVPELIQAGFVGYVTMETHSLNDIRSIYSVLVAIAEARANNPLGLRGVQCVLRRVPEKISVPGFGNNAGKRQRVEKWLVKLEPAASWVENQLALQRAGHLALPSGAVADAETGEIIDGVAYDTPAPDDQVEEPNAAMESADESEIPENGAAGVPKKENAEPVAQMSLDEACRVPTKRGNPIGNLARDQIQQIIDVYAASQRPLDAEEQKILAAAKMVREALGDDPEDDTVPF